MLSRFSPGVNCIRRGLATGPEIRRTAKSHRFRNGFLTVTLSIATFYAGGAILNDFSDKYGSLFLDNIPGAEDAVDLYDSIKYGNVKIPKISFEELKTKYSSFITGSTIGIPIHRPNQAPDSRELSRNRLSLPLFESESKVELTPELKSVVIQLNNVIQILNDENIELNQSQIDKMNSQFGELFAKITKFNDGYTDNISEKVLKGTKSTLDTLGRQYKNEYDKKERELEERYANQFAQFKEGLEKRVANTLNTSLKANEEKLAAKHDNEVAILSITQVDEFNKIIKTKVEQERNNKLSNLKELDQRVQQFTNAIDAVKKQLLRETIVTQLSQLISQMKVSFSSYEDHSLNIESKVQRMKLLASMLPKDCCKTNKKCSSTGSCSSKTCKCSMKKDTLLDVTLNELEATTTNAKILSNEQLYNRWNLLERDFKVASLLPPNAGMLGHLSARIFSYFLFTKSGTSPNGEDYDTLFAKVQDNLKYSRLGNALEDVIALEGWPRLLCENWIEDARRKLEVETLIDVINTELKIL